MTVLLYLTNLPVCGSFYKAATYGAESSVMKTLEALILVE